MFFFSCFFVFVLFSKQIPLLLFIYIFIFLFIYLIKMIFKKIFAIFLFNQKRENMLCVKKWMIFSSPKPKAQVNFSDQNVSVVYRRCPRCRRRKISHFHHLQNHLGNFDNNLHNVFFWKGLLDLFKCRAISLSKTIRRFGWWWLNVGI